MELRLFGDVYPTFLVPLDLIYENISTNQIQNKTFTGHIARARTIMLFTSFYFFILISDIIFLFTTCTLSDE